MAKIVLAMATTHGPQLHTTVEQWSLRVKADKSRSHPFRGGEHTFDDLVALPVEALSRDAALARRTLARALRAEVSAEGAARLGAVMREREAR